MAIDTVIRVDAESPWPHEYTAGRIRFRSKEPFSLDVNADYTLDNNQLVVENEVAVRGQILTVLGTPLGSEDFLPGFGSNLPKRIMDPINDMNAWLCTQDTIGALRIWMKDRIHIIQPGSAIFPLDEEVGDGYGINLIYEIIKSRQVTNYNFQMLR